MGLSDTKTWAERAEAAISAIKNPPEGKNPPRDKEALRSALRRRSPFKATEAAGAHALWIDRCREELGLPKSPGCGHERLTWGCDPCRRWAERGI